MDEKKLIEQKIFNDTSQYADIMELPHHVSKRHLPMPQLDRAFQFAPFGALEGFNGLINQTTTMYQHKKYPTGQQEQTIFKQIQYLQKHPDVVVDVTYFNPDSGFYEHVKGSLKRVESKKGRATFDETSVVVANIRNLKKMN